MENYKIIFEILVEVLNGQNLGEVIAKYKNHENYPKIKNISYNVIRYYYSLDFFTRKLLDRPNYKIDNILKVGFFEIWLSNKPVYAVINDLVNYTKENLNGLHGLVNAVLRKFDLEKKQLIEELNKDYKNLYNLPEWLITKIKQQYKNQALDIFKSLMLNPSFGVRVNPLKISQADYLKLLDSNNIQYNLIDNKLVLADALNINQLPLFNDGGVSIQDIAAQYLVDLLNKNNVSINNVLDACAAPGGKTCQLLENYKCKLNALEINKPRLKRIEENLTRLKLSAKIIYGNAENKKWWNSVKYDFILADVPCSAIGTIKRNPDIKITRQEEDLLNFIATQRKITINLWDMLVDGGYMVYSTCSILNEENEQNIDYFTTTLSNFKLIDIIKILPTQNNDGLFYEMIKKEVIK